ncbi:hypothetical protein [Zeaxanthinibacter enoshimensis]|uniref:Uncharacterized protein n=1 Tax=Zeaxanthinibacter enoshimensis TaxID=392009 RepID=A0A4R6TR07_9FLAO|nr:hypothetical protein [Zeaxanthinibacter enoshimensis]TDQ32563.1 hypothetical protein CLV82_0394 [Zeaxanthinibacter enoshimensis]
MAKGLLLFIIVFIVITLLHSTMMTIYDLSPAKRRWYQKIFWHFYFIYLVIMAVYQWILEGMGWLPITLAFVGIAGTLSILLGIFHPTRE